MDSENLGNNFLISEFHEIIDFLYNTTFKKSTVVR